MLSFNDFSAQGDEIPAIHDQIRQNRLVHALLITGEPGTGKNTLAGLIAASLMCTAGPDAPCGVCQGCILASSGEHPDITVIEKGKPIAQDIARGRSTIPVDDIREVIRKCSQYAFEGGNRAVIIRHAEDMTVQAQNCLLKILEEPPESTYFLLTSSHPDRVLTTVKSRCRTVRLIPWDTARIQKLLEEAGTESGIARKAAAASGGSIGKAFSLVSDEHYWKLREDVTASFFRNRKRSEILPISSSWKDRKNDADTIFSMLEDDIRKLLVYHLDPDGGQDIGDFPAEWQRFAANAPVVRFTELSDRIRNARKQNAFNVNFQAIIEQLLLIFIGESDLWAN